MANHFTEFSSKLDIQTKEEEEAKRLITSPWSDER